MKKIILVLVIILLSLFVFSAETGTSNDANGESSIVEIPLCSASEFLQQVNCPDLVAANVNVADTYDKYVSWCNSLSEQPIGLDDFQPAFAKCMSGANQPQKSDKDCDPVRLLTSFFISSPGNAMRFDDLYEGYALKCSQLELRPLPHAAIKEFLTTQQDIDGVKVVENNGVLTVYGLVLANKDSKPTTITKPTTTGKNTTDTGILGLVTGLFSNTTFLIVLVIGILILIVIVIIVSFFLLKKKQNDIIKEMQAVKEKMIALERTYLKGKLDESTYRKLMQQYQLRFTELELEIARLKKKQEKITKEQKEESD
jgi:uncharacterized membrane protein